MAVYSANRVGSIKESNDMREIMESIVKQTMEGK